MAKVFIEESTLTEIGDAIRAKKSSSGLIPVPNMASEIMSIESGAAGAGAIELIINVESGSTVTCFNADLGETYTTISVDNEATFNQVGPGIWSLTATKGDKTTSRTIEITNPTFGMRYETLLYDNGNYYEEETGGWQYIRVTGSAPNIQDKVSPTTGKTWMRILNSSSCVYIPVERIDLGPFSKIEFQGNCNGANGDSRIIVLNDDFVEWANGGWSNYLVKSAAIENIDYDDTNGDPTLNTVQSLDISDINGNYRIGIGLTGTNTAIVRMASFKLV